MEEGSLGDREEMNRGEKEGRGRSRSALCECRVEEAESSFCISCPCLPAAPLFSSPFGHNGPHVLVLFT